MNHSLLKQLDNLKNMVSIAGGGGDPATNVELPPQNRTLHFGDIIYFHCKSKED